MASALNLVRMRAWLMETPRAQTRVSRLARLAPAQQKAASRHEEGRGIRQQQQHLGKNRRYTIWCKEKPSL